MNNKLKYLIFAILAGLVILFFYNKYRVAPGVDFSKVNLYDMEGKPVQFSSFKGKKLVVSFSASWCGNCITELRALNAIKDKDLPDVEIIVISDEDLETVQQFKEKFAPSYTVLKMDQPFPSLGINAIPVNYIFNTKLENTEQVVGEIDWKDPSTVERLKKLME
jgi:thiol-disulfide isomerase/thioredoxin